MGGQQSKRSNQVISFLRARGGRVIMLATVAAASAYGFGAPAERVVLSALAGFFSAIAGFLLDTMTEMLRQRRIAIVSADLGTAFPIIAPSIFIAGALLVALLLNPFILIPITAIWGLVLLIELYPHPLIRAAGLGLLQGCYVVIGALAAPSPSPAPLFFLVTFLFFAMSGGRVLGDIRDIEKDRRDGIPTLPLKFGMKKALAFFVACEILAYITGLVSAALPFFGRGWLFCMMGITAFGVAINAIFLSKPTPSRANLANNLSLGLLGGFFVLGMILGRIV